MIWSSAQIMQHMIMSQMSQTKLNTKMLVMKFTPQVKPVADIVLEFLKPFNYQFLDKALKVDVIEANPIPSWACTDWKLYEQILYHLVQNSVKFNQENGSIKIILSYHSFEEEFKQDGPLLENAIGLYSYKNIIPAKNKDE